MWTAPYWVHSYNLLHTCTPIRMFHVNRRRCWLISKSPFSHQCIGRIRDTCSQLTWKSHSPHTHGGTFQRTLTSAQTLYLQSTQVMSKQAQIWSSSTGYVAVWHPCRQFIGRICDTHIQLTQNLCTHTHTHTSLMFIGYTCSATHSATSSTFCTKVTLHFLDFKTWNPLLCWRLLLTKQMIDNSQCCMTTIWHSKV